MVEQNRLLASRQRRSPSSVVVLDCSQCPFFLEDRQDQARAVTYDHLGFKCTNSSLGISTLWPALLGTFETYFAARIGKRSILREK